MAWEQRFEKCHGKLELRVGGPSGPLIRWPDRGQGGQFTWSSGDPEGEVRDISTWTGHDTQIRLYALVVEGGAPEDPLCRMSTLFDGKPCRQWQFDADEDHDIERILTKEAEDDSSSSSVNYCYGRLPGDRAHMPAACLGGG